MKMTFFIVAFTLGIAHVTIAQQEEEKLNIVIKESAKPDVYINGVKYPTEVINIIDNDKIKSVSVLKDAKAMEEYDAPNGVILITTKENANEKSELRVIGYSDSNKSSFTDEDRENIKIRLEGRDKSKNPLIIVDGKVIDKGLDTLDPNEIQSISVLKGESASAKGYDAPNGVIIITLKK